MTVVVIHNHTEHSVMDGLSTAREAARRAAQLGIPALAVTDHGGCFGHVDHQRACDEEGIAPIFGIETYFQPDRLARPPATADLRARLGDLLKASGGFDTPETLRIEARIEQAESLRSSLLRGRHLVLLAQGDKGLHDLWAASTEAYVTGFYGKPRMDWALLEERGSDLIATTACLGGIVSDDVKHGRVPELMAKLDRLKATFPGRLYLEVQANDLPDQVFLNKALEQVGEVMGIPLAVACDAHYTDPGDAELHRQWMLCQTGAGKDDYWNFSPMLGEQQIRESLGYLDPKTVDAAIRSTVEIAARCTARIGGHAEPPVFTPGGTADDDARALHALCEANPAGGQGREYRDRQEREFEVVSRKGLAGCYLIVHDLIRFARSRGFLVGPGRGSAAGSLMSYRLGITSVDPLKAGLLFERFLTEGREALPDFDLDFPTSARTPVQDYAVDRYGADHVVRVGTIMRYGTKGIINKLLSIEAAGYRTPRTGTAQGSREALESLAARCKADASAIGKIIDAAEAGTAGIGLAWDEHMENPDLAEYRERYTHLFALAERLHGRVYAQGQHPAGLIISPGRPMTGAMPMRHASTSDKLLVSQWDYRAAEDLGLLKIDLLTLRTLDTLSEAIRLVEDRTGIRLDPRSWDVEHLDPQVYDAVDTGLTSGIFQLETRLCSDYARRMRPRTLADLADLTTFIRPGPRNSGATEKYLRRRSGAEPVDYPHPLLEEMLRSSYGVMLYQEDVMRACKLIAGYSDLEADGVRKILGKKLVDKVAGAGEEFVRRAVERGHDEQVIRPMWEAMAEFGRYAFNKSHGFSYGVLSYWCVGGQTRIYDWDKREYVSIAKAYREGITTTACYDPETGKTIPGRVSRVIRTTGAKNKNLKFGWRMTTSSRKKLVCSERHLILTPDGYKRLEEIEVGDLVAAEKRHSQSGREDIRQAIAEGVRRSWAASTEESRKDQTRHLSDPEARKSRLASWRANFDQKTSEQKYERVRPFIEAAAESSGRLGTAPCGSVTHSPDEGTVCQWLMDNDVKHEHQVPLPSGKIADFRVKGVFVEVNSRTWLRSDEYWEQKYGDEPYVLTDAVSYEDDLHWVLEEIPMRRGADVTWERVISVEPVGDMVMYDIVMEGEPHNFLANGIVVHNTAWMKEHYPAEFLTALMSTVDMDRLPEFATEARRIGLTVLPPDVSYCQGGFACHGITLRYGLLAIPQVGKAAVKKITAAQPYSSYTDFLARSGADAGVVYALAKAGALDGLVPSRRGLVRVIESDRDGSSVRCVHKTDDPEAFTVPHLPCTYDWEADAREQEERHALLMAPRVAGGRKPLKLHVKPPPARCTRACRRYTPPAQADMAAWGEYSPAALFRADLGTYGTWMSEALWERLDELSPGLRADAREMARFLVTAGPGSYPVAAVVADVHSATTRSGSAMWWVKLMTEVSVLDLACFSPRRDGEPDVPAALRGLRAGTLVQAEARRRSYMSGGILRMGWNLTALYPLG